MAEDEKQAALFDKGEWWQEHWKGMPEYISEDLTAFHTIYVHFEKREDMEAFSRLVAQKISLTTQSIWYPEAEIRRFANKRYIDAPPPKLSEDVDTEEL